MMTASYGAVSCWSRASVTVTGACMKLRCATLLSVVADEVDQGAQPTAMRVTERERVEQ
jgi:hypothetical protein